MKELKVLIIDVGLMAGNVREDVDNDTMMMVVYRIGSRATGDGEW